MVAPGGAPEPRRHTRVAVDVPGGERADPGPLVDLLRAASALCPELALVLVATPETAAAAREHGVEVLPATAVVDSRADAARQVRAVRGVTVRVASRALRDGAVEAMVSFGPPAATIAAAGFTLTTLPGATRRVLAAVVTAPDGPLVLVDVSGADGATADQVAQGAALGAALAHGRLGVAAPRVGLLGPAAEQAAPAVPGHCVGPVRGADVVRGGAADVVVVDGATGAVLVSALSAARPTAVAEAHVLGVAGVVTVGLSRATPAAVAHCAAAAAAAHHGGTPALAATRLAALAAARRADLLDAGSAR